MLSATGSLRGNMKPSVCILCIAVLLGMCRSVQGSSVGVRRLSVMLKEVVYETEEGSVITDHGSFRLPGPATKVEMASSGLSLLTEKLIRLTGKKVVLCLDDDVVVGVSNNQGIHCVPHYKVRKKIVYATSPLRISTTLVSWDADTYRLSLNTKDGIFCISNDYEVSDYYRKVYAKLSTQIGGNVRANTVIAILYHPEESDEECRGEVEDVILK